MKKTISLLLAISMIATFLSTAFITFGSVADIPDSAVEFNGHYYYLFTDYNGGTAAQEYCESLGGHLATISSVEENEFLFQYITSLGYENAYFGFTDYDSEDSWHWVTGEDVIYTNWHDGEPNSESESEDWAMFYWKYQDGMWNDGGPTTNAGENQYICEWENQSAALSEEQLSHEDFIREHLEFINSGKYADAVGNSMAATIAEGLSTPQSDAAEALYNVLNTTSEILSCKALSIAENPYETVLAALILKQTDTSINEYKLNYNNSFLEYVGKLEKLCEMADPDWAVHSSEYKTYLEKLIADPKNYITENEKFYKIAYNVFPNIDQNELNNLLYAYQEASTLQSALKTYGSVVEWVSDCFKYNSLVSAYMSTSDEFKETLLDINTQMAATAYKEGLIGDSYSYAYDFNSALYDYVQFENNDEIFGLLLKEYTLNGLEKTLGAFSGTITTKICAFLEEQGLGGSWLYAAIFAYKTGWKISESITNNGDFFDCKELARAFYYLEDAALKVVERNKEAFLADSTYENAVKFDSSYCLLRNIETEAITNYISLLEYQQSSIRAVFDIVESGKINPEYNLAEISLAQIELLKWNEATCHYVPVVEPKQFVAGTFINKETNEPVSGLEIAAYANDNQYDVYTTQTDENGWFIISLDPGSIRLDVISDDYETYNFYSSWGDDGFVRDLGVVYLQPVAGVWKINFIKETTTAPYAAYADILKDYESRYGYAKYLLDYDYGYPHCEGVFFLDLIDFRKDGTEELVIGYAEPDNPHLIDVYQSGENGLASLIYSGRPNFSVGGIVDSIWWNIYHYSDKSCFCTGYGSDFDLIGYDQYGGFGIIDSLQGIEYESTELYDFGGGYPLSNDLYSFYGSIDADKMQRKVNETKQKLGMNLPGFFTASIYATGYEGLALKASPDVNAERYMYLYDGTIIEIDSVTEDGWGHTTYNGYSGWVYLRYTKVLGNYLVDPPTWGFIESADYIIYNTLDEGLELRIKPDSSFSTYGPIYDNQIVRVEAINVDWAYTYGNGRYGWCYMGYMMPYGNVQTNTAELAYTAGKELSYYLGTDIYDFIAMFPDMWKVNTSDGTIEYRNDAIIVSAGYDYSDNIDFISIDLPCEHTLKGISYGMIIDDAMNIVYPYFTEYRRNQTDYKSLTMNDGTILSFSARDNGININNINIQSGEY